MTLTQTLRNWRQYRTTVNALERMPNRQLADLGITRGSIRDVARQAL